MEVWNKPDAGGAAMKRITLGIGLGTWLLGVLAASGLSARQSLDLCRIEAEADAIRCLADELRPELRDHFHCSCLFRELNAARNDVESAARRVRSMARSRNRVCDLPREVACLAEEVNELRCLVGRARGFRRDFGPRGLDLACGNRVERILSEMCHRTALLEALVTPGHFGGHWGHGQGGNWGAGWGPDWGTGTSYSGPTGFGYSGPTSLGYSGPTTYGGTYLRSDSPDFGTGRANQMGREVERNRTVSRSRELQKMTRNR